MTISKRIATAISLVVTVLVMAGVGAPPALAESHPFLRSFGSFSNPNGIAVNEASGDVYVADLGTNTVYKFDSSGAPVNFSSLGSNALTGSATPAGSFAFPELPDTPAAIAVNNSKSPSDPSADDLYVMDAGHGTIDKFSASGKYLSQITGFAEGELLGIGVNGDGSAWGGPGIGGGVAGRSSDGAVWLGDGGDRDDAGVGSGWRCVAVQT